MVLTPFVLDSVIAESDSEDYEDVKEKLSLKKSEIDVLDDSSQFEYGIDFYDDGSLDLDDSSRGVVVFVEKLIDAAVERNASDILLEPQPTNAIVKFKIDNQFHPVSIIPKSFINSVTSRIKIISKLDIAERRLPQESARFKYKTSTATVNCAVYTVPTKGGAEIIKLNFLYDFARQLQEMKALLVEEDSIGYLKAAFAAADGLVLMCGDIRQHATYLIHTIGSILKTKNAAVYIIEEDDFIDTSDTIQIKLNPSIGLDRLRALRSVFKLDPQLVLLDNLSDQDVLSFAVKKVYKGSKCCIIGPIFLESFSRMLAYLSNQAGISTYDIAGALNKALNITFIRRNCESCKVQYALGDSDRLMLQKLGLAEITPMQGTGCDTCWGTGYNGRHMLLELLDFSDDLSAAFIAGEVDAARISQAISPAFGTISEQAIRCLRSGTTSLEEFRATL
jgi:type II secretory ATPase GspE/PulE/Tfp pilus assembly ATPase PilB-like protein